MGQQGHLGGLSEALASQDLMMSELSLFPFTEVGTGSQKQMTCPSLHSDQGFPGSSEGKETTCNAGDLGSIHGLGRSPGGGHGNPLQFSCLENPHGQRSLEGYSP